MPKPLKNLHHIIHSKDQLLQLLIFFIVLVAIPITIYGFEPGFRLMIGAHQDQVDLFFAPQNKTVTTPTSSLKLMVNAKHHRLSYLTLQIKYDPHLIRLEKPAIPSPIFAQAFTSTPIHLANQSGTLQLNLQLNSHANQLLPTGIFQLAQLVFVPNTSKPNQTAVISISSDQLNLTDHQLLPLRCRQSPGYLHLNPSFVN